MPFGPIKRKDLLRYLANLDLKAPLPAANISILSKVKLSLLFLIHIRAKSVATCLPESCGKLVLSVASGKNFENFVLANITS